MKQSFDLSTLSWTLSGWHPNFWKNRISMETGIDLYSDIGPVPVTVPGSVQEALRAAGYLPDWNVGFNSRQCEWVENRHWIFETILPAEWLQQDGCKLLVCDGLDYQGMLYLNGKSVDTFRGTFVPHTFDLTPHLREGDNRLTVVFTDLPTSLGQVGYTSEIVEWKERFNYIWDWTPRLVQVGIWDGIRLEVRDEDTIEALTLYTDFDTQAGLGTLTLQADLDIAEATTAEVLLEDGDGFVIQESFDTDHHLAQTITGIPVTPWQPNGNGEAKRYTLRLRLLTADGRLLEETTRTVGFRQIRWLPCAGAPADAEPWVCEVNGVPTFLQGINWVPIRPVFADVTEADYRKRLELYRDLGLNLLRVWGGAVLEKEIFYQLCDELGIMVWQEFPLSSSGIDNWPPEDPTAIAEMREIAISYINRRQHHPALLLWCGGNELQGTLDGGKQGCGKPVDYTHPMIGMLREVVQAYDPTRRFIPTSSSGPRFVANKADFGKGLHHDVHGPWNMSGPLEGWYDYWQGDDALFRSETGFPSAQSAELIRQYGDTEPLLPASRTNPLWMHTGGWWIQWEDYLREGGDAENLEQFVAWSQQRQADALVYAARVCKERFPAMGGIIFWMGHDCYPCMANTAIVDVDGNPKPAALAVAEIFKAKVEVK